MLRVSEAQCLLTSTPHSRFQTLVALLLCAPSVCAWTDLSGGVWHKRFQRPVDAANQGSKVAACTVDRFEQRNISDWTGCEVGQNHQNVTHKDPTDLVVLAEYLRRWLVHGFYLLEVAGRSFWMGVSLLADLLGVWSSSWASVTTFICRANYWSESHIGWYLQKPRPFRESRAKLPQGQLDRHRSERLTKLKD